MINTSEKTESLYKALFQSTQELQTLKKDATGYGYKYLTLEAIIDYVKPILARHGLFYVQMVGSTENGNIGLTTRIIHESGEWMESAASIPLTDMKGVNKSQAAGAAITYLRRYSLTALLGLAENDTDGLSNEEVKARQNKPKPQPIDPEKEKILHEVKKFYIEREDFKKTEYIDKMMSTGDMTHYDRVISQYNIDNDAKQTTAQKVEKVMGEDSQQPELY